MLKSESTHEYMERTDANPTHIVAFQQDLPNANEFFKQPINILADQSELYLYLKKVNFKKANIMGFIFLH